MLTLRVEGNEHIVSAFGKVTDKHLRFDLMDQIGAYGVSSTQQRFIDETGPEGIRWLKSERAKIENGQTLRDEGFLYQSMTHDFNDKSTEWGTNRPYASIHQTGGTIVPKAKKALAFRLAGGRFVMVKKVTIPARPFLGVNNEDGKEIEAIAVDWLRGCLQ